MTEENESMLDDSFDDKPVDEVFEGEEVIRGQTEDEVYLDEDTFEQGDSLVGEKYVSPTKDEKFVDVHKGTIVDKKDVAPILQIKAFYEAMNMKIGEPKSGCNKCYGRGYTGFDIKAQTWLPCKCLFPAMSRVQREQQDRQMRMEGKLNNTPENMRYIRKMMRKEEQKQRHSALLNIRDKIAEGKKLIALSANSDSQQIMQTLSATQEANNG